MRFHIITYQLLFLISIHGAFAQSGEITVTRIEHTLPDYRKIALLNDTLYATNDSGQLVVWDLRARDTIAVLIADTPHLISGVGIDRNNRVLVGTDWGAILQPDLVNRQLNFVLDAKYQVVEMCFNSKNEMYVAVPYTIFDPIDKKYWYKFGNHSDGMIYTRRRFFGLFSLKVHEYFVVPDFAYLDSHGRWWLCREYGEYGGDIQIFDVERESIYDNYFEEMRPGLMNAQSVCEDKEGNVYVTSGSRHMMFRGTIYKITKDREASVVMDSEDFKDTVFVRDHRDSSIIDTLYSYDMFIGPTAYHPGENALYFAGNKGIMKATLPAEGRIKKIEPVMTGVLEWKNASRANGTQIIITKLFFTEDFRLVFLTAGDGVGILDKDQLLLVK